MSERPALELSAVSHSYRRNRPVLSELTWLPGRCAALLGPNGAGKSTLFAVASGALRPTSGSVEVGERPASAGDVVWMPQTVQAMPGLRAQEQVALAGWMHGLTRQEAWERATGALEAVDLTVQAGERAAELSGGQLRRLGVAEVLVAEPRVVLLDEPTVGLDPLQRDQLRTLIAGLAGDRQVVVATHLVEDLEVGFDSVAVLVDGAIRFDGSVDAFLAHASAGGSFAERAVSAYRALAGPEPEPAPGAGRRRRSRSAR